jgi:predicted O-methyltransferase YrrM
MLKSGISMALVFLRTLSLRMKFIPAHVRFQLRGHGDAWKIFTHLTQQERLFLYRVGLRQPNGALFLEVGSYLGASTLFLAAAAKEIGHGAKVHSVDTWENQGMSEGFRDTWSEFNENTKSYTSCIVSHRGKSIQIAQTFTGQIDLLFLDGDHSYEGCRLDVENWLPHLKPGGLIIMHDYGWAEGVQKVVYEFIQPRAVREGSLPNLYWAWIK